MEEGLIASKDAALEFDFSDIFLRSKQEGYGFAFYRLPKKTDIHIVIDCSGGQSIDKVNLEQLKDGYVLHPFSSAEHSIKFLERDIHFVKNEKQQFEVKHSVKTDDELQELFSTRSADRFVDDFQYHWRAPSNEEKSRYIRIIEKSLDEIRSNNLQKVVVSRTKKVPLSKNFNPVRLFELLEDKYKNAFVHVTHIPDAGTWVGATPETLINIDRSNQFETVALAATQAYNPKLGIEETAWSQKEIEEQAMVSRYIINCFKKIRLREFEEIGPRTYLSGHLAHLKTNYIVDLNQVNFPELGSVMLELLHPTSAICGMPKETSQRFIEEHEDFDRAYFSGFLGPVHMNGETNLFVNLRCANIAPMEAQLYAGAGIIANSNPEKEWKETEIKMDTLLAAFKEM